MQSISIDAWADREKIPRRKVYRWVKTGKVPTVPRKIVVKGIPSSITKKDIVKA